MSDYVNIPDFYVRQGDTLTSLSAVLSDETGPIDLTAASVAWHMRNAADPTAPVLDEAAIVVDAPNGAVRYDWAPTDLDAAGDYLGEWQVTFAGGAVATFPNWRYLNVRVTAQIA